MGYTKIVPRPHVCPVPWLAVSILAGHGVGTTWVCDHCLMTWVLCGNGTTPTKWEQDGVKAADLLDRAARVGTTPEQGSE